MASPQGGMDHGAAGMFPKKAELQHGIRPHAAIQSVLQSEAGAAGVPRSEPEPRGIRTVHSIASDPEAAGVKSGTGGRFTFGGAHAGRATASSLANDAEGGLGAPSDPSTPAKPGRKTLATGLPPSRRPDSLVNGEVGIVSIAMRGKDGSPSFKGAHGGVDVSAAKGRGTASSLVAAGGGLGVLEGGTAKGIRTTIVRPSSREAEPGKCISRQPSGSLVQGVEGLVGDGSAAKPTGIRAGRDIRPADSIVQGADGISAATKLPGQRAHAGTATASQLLGGDGGFGAVGVAAKLPSKKRIAGGESALSFGDGGVAPAEGKERLPASPRVTRDASAHFATSYDAAMAAGAEAGRRVPARSPSGRLAAGDSAAPKATGIKTMARTPSGAPFATGGNFK